MTQSMFRLLVAPKGWGLPAPPPSPPQDKSDSYATWVGVNERFMVYVSVDGGSKQDLDAFVNAINYGGIANLK